MSLHFVALLGLLACLAPARAQQDVVAWYDAGDARSLELSGDRVAVWKDRSGAGHDAVAATAEAGRPQLVKEAGVNVVDVAGRALQTAPFAKQFTSLTLHALVAAPPGYHPLISLNTTGKPEFFAGGWTIGNHPGIFSASGLVSGAQEVEDGGWHVLSFVRDGAARALYVDGVPAGGGTSKDVSVEATCLDLFRWQGSGIFKGKAAEMQLLSRGQSATEVAAAVAALRRKWAPLFSAASTPLVALVGNSLSTGMFCGNGKTWTAQTAAAVPLARWFNVSKGGITTAGLAALSAAQVDPLLQFGTGARVLLFWEGTNELVVNKASPEAAHEAIKAYCLARRAAGWKAIAVLSVMPREVGGDFEERRTALNQLLRTHYKEYADALIDVEASPQLGAPGANLNRDMFPDGVHLSARGNALVATLAAPVVKALLMQRAE